MDVSYPTESFGHMWCPSPFPRCMSFVCRVDTVVLRTHSSTTTFLLLSEIVMWGWGFAITPSLEHIDLIRLLRDKYGGDETSKVRREGGTRKSFRLTSRRSTGCQDEE